MRRFRSDKGGTTGFFEDLPALAVVIMSFVIYISLMNSVLESSTKTQGELDFSYEVNEFLRSLRSAGCLTHNGVTGLFDYQKVMHLTVENLTREIDVDYDYRVEIMDVSGYYMNYSKSVNTSSVEEGQRFEKGMWVGVSSAAIWVSDEEVHSARVVVTIWA